MTLRIDAGGEQVLEETVTLASEDTDESASEKRYDEVVGTDPATIHVTVQDGPERTTEFTDTEADARGLFVDIYANRIQFQQYVA